MRCAPGGVCSNDVHIITSICPLAFLPTRPPLAHSPPRSVASEWLPVKSLSRSHGHPAPTCQLS
jgi:hypothetical protein